MANTNITTIKTTLLVMCSAFVGGIAHAQTSFRVEPTQAFPKARIDVNPGVDEKSPVLLEANDLYYDHNAGIVIATGVVEIIQNDTIVIADQLIYDQEQDRLFARGNVSMLEPTGNVYFADNIELEKEMKTGVINQFKARLSDDSLFAARQAQRIDENTIELQQAVYSPCKVCNDEGEARAPLWQIKADHVTVDNEEQKVIYENAYFETYGMPVFYTPYISHPTPNADNQSGFLVPEYEHTNNLGSVVKIPVYYAIAPDKDATITPIYTTLEGLVMAGEYRQRFNTGTLRMDGSITYPSDRDASGARSTGRTVRGNINALGDFSLDENYKWGFDIQRVTDDTYLRRYNFSYDTLLTSTAYMEGYNFVGGGQRSYGVVRGLAFQGLTAQDNSSQTPTVFPLGDFTYESDPGIYNSRVLFDANTMLLHRDDGAKSRRASGALGWKLPYITDDGQLIEFTARTRADVYSVEDQLLSSGEDFQGVTGRVIPEAIAKWRYPFINQWEDGSMLIEPVVMAAISAPGGNPEEIPNEDSLVPEFTDTNLFEYNRYPGYDRVETGPRVSYGVQGQAQMYHNKYVNWLFGQHYRSETDRNFPFSNEVDSHFSDYVGHVGFSASPLNLAYRFRLDKDEFSPKRSEIDASFDYKWMTLAGAYLLLDNDPILADREQAVGSSSVRLSKNWSWQSAANRNLLTDEWVSLSTGLTYADECTNVSMIAGRQFTRDRDIEPTTTFLFRIAFKNLN
ncbi:MAG: LPS-assembly protein LptD [Alphaproteobacteria bacterium]